MRVAAAIVMPLMAALLWAFGYAVARGDFRYAGVEHVLIESNGLRMALRIGAVLAAAWLVSVVVAVARRQCAMRAFVDGLAMCGAITWVIMMTALLFVVLRIYM